MILELVANDQPLEQVAATMAQAVASHLPDSLCAIRIQVPGDEQIALYPKFPPALAQTLNRLELDSINAAAALAPIGSLSDVPLWHGFVQGASDVQHRFYRAVPVMRGTERAGIILSLFSEERADDAQQKLLESWGRFATLAVERRGLYKQLSFRAQYDSLTHLLNRASLYERLEGLLHTSTGGAAPLGVVYLDLDCFKEINDNFGHAIGDRVLQHVSERIMASVRHTDVVARLGGDEFVIVVPGVGNRNEVTQVADAVAAAVSGPLELDGQLLMIGASLGISVCPIDGKDPEQLLKVADESMYQAKLTHRSGRALRSKNSETPEPTAEVIGAAVSKSGAR